ncbi:MAG TPA: ATP-binding cassette domain-containing protein [Nitrosospira sp.]|nr:ATP-binding cassette domain-containing protein [Nitrosospira sp.]
MSNAECIVKVEGLHTRFGTHVVHEDINLCVRRGEVLALVGGSGEGKTALMREMLGLDAPTQGTIQVFGEPLQGQDRKKQQQMRNRCGVLFQKGALFSALSVYDNIALPLRELHTLDEAMIRDLVMLKLKMVEIAPAHATKMPSELSGGMIKRIALARAMALSPELLFLDEPTAGLDPELSEGFVKLIQAMRRELTLTIVMATHDLDTLIALADRIAVLAQRRMVALGTLEEVIRTEHPFVQNYFCGERGKRTIAGQRNS